jgi:hypothetical protein
MNQEELDRRIEEVTTAILNGCFGGFALIMFWDGRYVDGLLGLILITQFEVLRRLK